MTASIIRAEAADLIKNSSPDGRLRRPEIPDLRTRLERRVVGQPNATRVILPHVEMFQAGLAPTGRPAGVFLLLGPTGTGKTRTVEALAEVLHGSDKTLLKVDCGEFQMEHEVAKLIGAPPGYLGHRETQPLLTQQRLTSATSENCGLSLVLFDEIEKAAPSMTRLLLGVLDKAVLRLGDNTAVNFENSLIFLTSNLGAREMWKEIQPDFGFRAGGPPSRANLRDRLEQIGTAAVRRKFSPEFVNRIDGIVTYLPLEPESLAAILDQRLIALQAHIDVRLGRERFAIAVGDEARSVLLRMGTSSQYGARELNRTIHRQILQPVASLMVSGGIQPGATVCVEPEGEGSLRLDVRNASPAGSATPSVLVVDDNREMIRFLERLVTRSGWKLLPAETSRSAREAAAGHHPRAVLVDYRLPDGTGVDLALDLRRKDPKLKVVIMSGLDLTPDEQVACEEHDFLVLRKPFLAAEVIEYLENRIHAR